MLELEALTKHFGAATEARAGPLRRHAGGARIVAVMLLAARVYGRAVLRTGSRIGLAAVLRGGA